VSSPHPLPQNNHRYLGADTTNRDRLFRWKCSCGQSGSGKIWEASAVEAWEAHADNHVQFKRFIGITKDGDK
jgi:hypothetical protein